MPPRSSSRPIKPHPSSPRPSGTPLDPYGIYSARTATRLRDSRRRRRSQNLIAALIFLAFFVALVTAWRTRRVNTDVPQGRRELGMAVSVAPIWIQTTRNAAGVLLIAGEDGRLVETGAFGETKSSEADRKKTVLLETDFPLRPPLIFGETAYVPCEDGVLYAVSWRQRKLLWRQRFDAALTAKPALIIINKKPVVVAGSDAGLLLALDAASGGVLWRARLPAPVGDGMTAVQSRQTASDQSSPARVLVPLLGGAAMRGGLWCLDGANGKVLWRFPKDGRVEATQLSAPVVDASSGKVYGANDAGAVYCLDLQTGSYNVEKQSGWKTFIRPLEDHDQEQVTLLRAAPLLIAPDSMEQGAVGRLIVGGNDGGVRCVNAADGKLIWQSDTGAPVSALISVKNSDERESVLVCNRSGELILLDSGNGAMLRKFSSGGERFVGAAVTSQEIYGMTSKGTILQFALSQ